MGLAGDKNYCVDLELRIHEVKNLRVVDGSIFPTSPGAIPNGPTSTYSRKASCPTIQDTYIIEIC